MVLVYGTSSHLSSIYKPSFISIPIVLSKIWPGNTSIVKETMAKGR